MAGGAYELPQIVRLQYSNDIPPYNLKGIQLVYRILNDFPNSHLTHGADVTLNPC